MVSVARPLSEEKREAILAAAAASVADLGIGAPTARIAAGAHIAEGTLFSYFPTKDVLLNQLYIALKQEVGAAILAGYRPGDEFSRRWRLVWDRWIAWGAANPAKRKALRQLQVSERISTESRQIAGAAIAPLHDLLDESIVTGAGAGAGDDPTRAFLGSMLEALAEVTLDFIAREPDRRAHYAAAGFRMLWNALAHR
jgi:AcrR family transcriptional regulator